MSEQDPPVTDRRPGVAGELRPPVFPGDENKWRGAGMERVHVVFSNDGSVKKISGCPEGIGGQDWFNFLSRKTCDRYESLSGGRGVFRFEKEEIEALAGEVAGNRK